MSVPMSITQVLKWVGTTDYKTILVVALGLAAVGCRPYKPSGVVIEVAPFVNVNLRSSGEPADISKAKIIGEPTDSEIKEVAEVIGRIIASSQGSVKYIRITRRHDGLEVDFAVGHDLISMRKTQNNWVVFAKGGIF